VKIEHLTRLLDAEYDAGFKAGIEAAAKVADEAWEEYGETVGCVGEEIRALSTVAKKGGLHDPTTCESGVICSCRHEPSFHGASGCMDDNCGCIASGDECHRATS
jgi:hypothetical protein